MATGSIGNPEAGSPRNLKQAFDTAIGALNGDETDLKARTPIYRRKRDSVEESTALSAERALTDAADALAALWKAAPARLYTRSIR
jgi:hypothetical protein